MGLALSLLIAVGMVACKVSIKRSMGRIEQKISADEKYWNEALAALDVPPHEYEGYER